MNEDEMSKWNDVYKDGAEKLPWHDLPFSKDAEDYLKGLSKQDPMLVVGCGGGISVNRIHDMGFENITGTDISTEAISQAARSFPNLAFEAVPTEELKDHPEFSDTNVFDWLNLHQISPDILESYLESLTKIAKTICISWIYNKGESERKSYTHTGNIFFHDPDLIKSILIKHGFFQTKDGQFTFTSKMKVDIPIVHQAVTQVYRKD